MNEPIPTGAIGDLRTDEEKLKDFNHEEIAGATILDWSEKTWKTYPKKEQFYTLECVAHSTTKYLGINEKKENGTYKNLSAEFFYDFRNNKPGGGMNWDDAMKIATSKGSCPFELIPQRKRESDPLTPITEAMVTVAKPYKGKMYFTAVNRDIDTIARIIEEQDACLLWVWFDVNGKEWWRKEPKIIYNSLATYDTDATRHAVIAVDYGMRNGEKVIVIEDSAGNSTADEGQRRYVDDKFLKRCFIAGYVIDEPNQTYDPIKPHYVFTKVLKVGSRGGDVIALQEILIYEGCLVLPNTPKGYFGGLTRAALIKWQEAHSEFVLKPWGLTKGTGVFAMKSIEYANKIYA